MWRTPLMFKTPDGTAYSLHGLKGTHPLILIHGLGLSRQLWAPFIPALSESFRVINYDLYGHGDSVAVSDILSLKVFSNQIVTLLNHVGEISAHIVGFSIGGMINRRFAMDYPERARKLVILNSPHNRGNDLQDMVEARAAKVQDQGVMATMPDALKRWFTPDYLAADNEGMELVKDWRMQVDSKSYAQAAWVLANGVRELIQSAPPLEHPTLVMTCENDSGSTPEMARDIAAEIQWSQNIVVPKLQHLGLMESPAAFIKPILKFLESQT
jgi:pimeloyl-ACP methyl ester carboxylesterase